MRHLVPDEEGAQVHEREEEPQHGHEGVRGRHPEHEQRCDKSSRENLLPLHPEPADGQPVHLLEGDGPQEVVVGLDEEEQELQSDGTGPMLTWLWPLLLEALDG